MGSPLLPKIRIRLVRPRRSLTRLWHTWTRISISLVHLFAHGGGVGVPLHYRIYSRCAIYRLTSISRGRPVEQSNGIICKQNVGVQHGDVEVVVDYGVPIIQLRQGGWAEGVVTDTLLQRTVGVCKGTVGDGDGVVED